MHIDTLSNGDEKLQLILEGLTPEEKDKLGRMLWQDKLNRTSGACKQDLSGVLGGEILWNVDEETKNKIISAVNKMQVHENLNFDGLRRVTFKVGNEKYVVVDPNRPEFKRGKVSKGGKVGLWNLNTLEQSLEEKESEMTDLLQKLGEQVGLSDRNAQFAMFVYLVGSDRKSGFRIYHDTI